MKRKGMILLLLTILLVSTNLNATSFSNRLPGGKNYLDINNFINNKTSDSLYSIDPIKVKPNTEYTFSMPGSGMIDDPVIVIESELTTYVSGDAYTNEMCNVDQYFTVCSFTTGVEETVEVSINGMFLSLFYINYGMTDFQLEEGNTRTDYEAYINPMTDSNSPEFNGSGAFVMSYLDNYSLQDIIDSHIVVMDDIDGDITDQIVVTTDNYTANRNIVGEYLVVLEATDTAGNKASFQLTIIIKDEISPTISGQSEIDINVDDGLAINSIITSHYIATDGYDTNILIVPIYDEYSVNYGTLGTYNVTLEASDSSGNKTTKDISLNVVDVTSPSLVGTNVITVYMSNPQTLDNILNEIIVTDNYDSTSSITTTVLSENYSMNTDTPGSYAINLLLTDTSGNNNSIDLFVTLIDDIAPTISGPSSYTYSYTQQHELNDLLGLFTVSDNVDSLTTSDLTVTTNTFSTKTTKVGTFLIEFFVTDTSGNTTEHSLTVTIIDDQAPVIYIDEFLITITESSTFNQQDALNLLVFNHELPDMNYEITVLHDEYTGNEKIPGTYKYSLQFEDEEGVEVTKDFVIKVADEEEMWNSELIVRNIVIYSISVGVFAFVIIKSKK